MKNVKAIPPYIYKGASNFKYYPCEAWEKIGGKVSIKSQLPDGIDHVKTGNFCQNLSDR